MALLDHKAIGDVFLDVRGKGESSVATRVLSTNRASLRKLPSASAAVLESHGIDQVAASALRRGELTLFAEVRTKLLDHWFHRFFTERSAPDDSDRPPVVEIVRRVEKELTLT